MVSTSSASSGPLAARSLQPPLLQQHQPTARPRLPLPPTLPTTGTSTPASGSISGLSHLFAPVPPPAAPGGGGRGPPDGWMQQQHAYLQRLLSPSSEGSRTEETGLGSTLGAAPGSLGLGHGAVQPRGPSGAAARAAMSWAPQFSGSSTGGADSSAGSAAAAAAMQAAAWGAAGVGAEAGGTGSSDQFGGGKGQHPAGGGYGAPGRGARRGSCGSSAASSAVRSSRSSTSGGCSVRKGVESWSSGSSSSGGSGSDAEAAGAAAAQAAAAAPHQSLAYAATGAWPWEPGAAAEQAAAEGAWGQQQGAGDAGGQLLEGAERQLTGPRSSGAMGAAAAGSESAGEPASLLHALDKGLFLPVGAAAVYVRAGARACVCERACMHACKCLFDCAGA